MVLFDLPFTLAYANRIVSGSLSYGCGILYANIGEKSVKIGHGSELKKVSGRARTRVRFETSEGKVVLAANKLTETGLIQVVIYYPNGKREHLDVIPS